jgi:hypothetical protein
MSYFSQFFYPDHLFFFGEKSIDTLLEWTGFKRVCVYREAILLQLLLQKAFWRSKEALKDKRNVAGMSMKRRLRLLYRYVSYYLVRLGSVLPKEGRPLKLLVIAEKVSSNH